jgi:assimilatory nitrate reductase catalytic subunit
MADLHLQIQPGTDVALFNGMLHHLIWEGLVAEDYISAHTAGFAELKQMVRNTTPKMAAEICGIREEDLIQAAEWFGHSPASLSLYCMGLNQSSHGTDKNLALINLHLATGQIGKPGAGPFSLTGQPNAMGGREVGGMATMLAAHRDIDNAEHRAEVAAHWGVPFERLSATPGLPAIAMFEALQQGRIKAIWIACSNPAHSLPNLPQVRAALAQAELVVVQDAFAHTDTTALADILLPPPPGGERRHGHQFRTPHQPGARRRAATGRGAKRWLDRQPDCPPPGSAAVSRRGQPVRQYHVASVFDEHRALTSGRDLDISGLSHAVLDSAGPQQWPLPAGRARPGAALCRRRVCHRRWPGAFSCAALPATGRKCIGPLPLPPADWQLA